jgi:uroporphyrinogen decarboxylase
VSPELAGGLDATTIRLAREGRGERRMRDGERLVRCLTFQDVDRPPYYQLMWAWVETEERWWRESGLGDNLSLSTYFDPDYGFAEVPVPLGLYPPFKATVVEESDGYYVERNERGIVMRRRRGAATAREYLDHPVKGWDDWERIKSERLDPDHPGRYRADLEVFNSYLRATGSVAQLGVYPYGVFGTSRDLMGAERVLLAFYDQADLVRDMMDYLTDFWIRIYERVTERVEVACIHIWEDMAGRNGSLISPQMVREFMMPNYRKISDFAQAKGIPLVSVDSDGDVSQLVPIMVENGVNVYWPFEVQAGCDIEEYRRLYRRLGIIGGMDKRALTKGKQAIDGELARAERMLDHGGYVASLDHMVPPDVSWEDFCYYMARLREIVGKT